MIIHKHQLTISFPNHVGDRWKMVNRTMEELDYNTYGANSDVFIRRESNKLVILLSDRCYNDFNTYILPQLLLL